MKTRSLTLQILSTICALALLLRPAAQADTAFPTIVSVVPLPFWSSLQLFKSEPKVSLVLVVPSFLTEGQPNYAAANGADFSALLGSNDSNSGFAPIALPEKSRTQSAAVNQDPGNAHRALATNREPSLADNWSRTAGVGSTIPAYSTGFGAVASSGAAATLSDTPQGEAIAAAIDHSPRYAGEAVGASSGRGATSGAAVQQSRSANTGAALTAPASSASAGLVKGETSHTISAQTIGANAPAPNAATGGDWIGPSGSVGTPTTGSWNTTTNWNPSGVPISGTTTNISFGGSGATAYTSTNNISGLFTFGTMTLNSKASVTETIAGTSPSTGFNINASQISQANSGAFNIQNAFDNTTTNAATTLTLTGGGTGLVTLSGVISEKSNTKTVSITKSGTSTFVLGGSVANTYTGLTTVNGGILELAKTGATAVAGNITIGDGATTAGLDILRLAGTGGNQIADSSILTFNGTGTNAGTLRMNGRNETIGGIASTGGAGVIENAGSGTSTLTLNVTGTNRDFSGIIRDGSAGTVALTKTGAATQTLSGANSYTGATLITGGKLQLGNGGATGSLSTSSTIIDNANLTINRNNAVTQGTDFSGSAITGSGSFTQAGSGTTTLTAANSYAGATQVNAGTLLINGNQSAATGAVTVNGSGTFLGGIGTIGGAVTVNAGANITGATNGSVGTLTLLSTATFVGAGSGSLATFVVDLLGATSDKLAISGALDLSNAFDQILFNGTADGTTTYTLATFASHGTFMFDTVTNLPGGYGLIYNTNSLLLSPLTPVPEPSTWVAGALALLAVGYTQRRRFMKTRALVSVS